MLSSVSHSLSISLPVSLSFLWQCFVYKTYIHTSARLYVSGPQLDFSMFTYACLFESCFWLRQLWSGGYHDSLKRRFFSIIFGCSSMLCLMFAHMYGYTVSHIL